MDFRHLIVTCLFSMLRLSFETQKIKENYAILNIKKPYVIPKRRNNFQFSTFNSQLLRIFANELTWIDLYCLQPREKMLKTYPFRCRPAEKSFQVQFSCRLVIFSI